MNRRTLLVVISIAVVSVMIVAVLRTPLSSIENQVTSLKYRFRGTLGADTNIVIVYVDNDAVKDLGRPVRRNFYALMIKALTDLNVRAIGVDVMFEEPKPEYPEYDELLAATIAHAKRVVLPAYFRSLSDQGRETGSREAGFSSYPGVKSAGKHGTEFHQPLEMLRNASSGIGHVNLGEGVEIPLFVESTDGVIPSFGMEVLRVFRGATQQEISFENSTVAIGSEIAFSAPGGSVSLNYPGPMASFRTYPFVEVLKSYDAVRLDRPPSLPVKELSHKIVLVSFVADERVFVNTPVAERYPSIGLHATFLDNALQSRFLSGPGTVFVSVLSFFLSLCCAGAIVFLRSPVDKMLAFGVPLVISVISFLLFVHGAYVLPLTSPVVVCMISTISSFIYKQRLAGAEVDVLQREKTTIIAQLKEKEVKVLELENELIRFQAEKSADRTVELLEQIRKYKTEIHSLSLQADDMEEFTLDHEETATTAEDFEGIIFDKNGTMKPVIDFIRKIAGSDAPVLVLGESGTGKELVARAIHKRSGKSERPFIAVNCGALSENLLESELFGHEKGAFTGAVRDKLGRFELADGGTIFLDEIGEVTESFQLKLLRVLQEGELERVGGTKTIKVNVRVIAATNKDLKGLVNSKQFREDLFYRLNVLTVSLPPLRERQEDIPFLIQHFLTREGAEMRISKNVMDALQAYAWRGNIRELESVMKRAALLARAEQRVMIGLKDLTEEVAVSTQGKVALEDQILESLREKGFSRSSVSETAEELGGLNRGTVAEYLRGQCFKAFVEQGFDIELTMKHISLSANEEVNERVRKKLHEYLSNISGVINPMVPWAENKPGLRPKIKNLPQRYHRYVEQVAEACHRRLWKVDS